MKSKVKDIGIFLLIVPIMTCIFSLLLAMTTYLTPEVYQERIIYFAIMMVGVWWLVDVYVIHKKKEE